jgi:branched-subunit amino acid transport protein
MMLVFLIVAMAIVTYMPRMLPLVLLQNVTLPNYINRFMGFIPYAALGALIFPGVLHSTGTNHLEPAIVGGIISVILAFLRCNLIVVVAGGITGAFVMNIVFW